MAKWFKMPECQSMEYAGDDHKTSKSKSSTGLDPKRVTTGRVPRLTLLDDWTRLTNGTIVASFKRLLGSSSFPDRIFEVGGLVDERIEDLRYQVDAAAPSGEAGVSHFLALACFDTINTILRYLYHGTEETRVWRVVGIGRTGRTDWGLYRNGVMVVIVEIKPHCVSQPSILWFHTFSSARGQLLCSESEL